MRLSLPSPGPTLVRTGRFAVGTVSPAVPGCWVVPPPPEAAELGLPAWPGWLAGPLLPLLQAASATDSAATLIAIAERVPLRLLVVVIAWLPPLKTLVAPLLARALSRNRECLRGPPCDADLIALGDRGAAVVGVLAADDQLAAGVERDDVTGEHAHVDDVGDLAAFHVRVRWRLVVLGEEGDLL